METEVLAKYEADLLAKEHSGAKALLRDDKVGLRLGAEGGQGLGFMVLALVADVL